MAHLDPVDKFYRSVIADVILECREIFLDEGIDEAVLTELKQMWEQKVRQAKVFEFTNWHGSHTSFGIGSYGIISSSRHTTVPEILVPSIHLSGPRGNGLNNSSTPTATIALPYGLYQQQISALNNAGISLQPNGNGQFLAFLRPDQQRLQSLTASQNISGSNKGNPITVSVSSSIPAKHNTVNLNANMPNRASTSPTKNMLELKKPILPAPTDLPGKDPNGNTAAKETGNTGYLNTVNIKTTSLNPKSTEYLTPNATNIPIPNNVPLDINTNPIIVTTNNNVIQTTGCLKTVSNTGSTNNSLAGNNCPVETIPPPVNTNSTIFSTIQNTYLPLNTTTDRNTNTVAQASNNQGFNDNNQSLGAPVNRFENPPLTNNYSSNAGFYYNTGANASQTEAMVNISRPADSLEDFMDNMSDSNCQSYNYSDPRPNNLIANRILSSDFNSNINSNNGGGLNSNTYSSHIYPPPSMMGNSLPVPYKPVPSSGDADGGQMCRISEADMQTIEEILQLDGAGDEYLFEEESYSTSRNPTSCSFSRKRWSVSTDQHDFSCKVNKTPIMESGGEIHQICWSGSETKNLHRLKFQRIFNTDSPQCDYIPMNKIRSLREDPVPSISRVPSGLNINQTMNKQGTYFKTNCLKISSSPKKPLQNIANSSSISLNCFGKWSDITKETPGGTTAILTPKRFGPFRSHFPGQIDGEDADSSSSSDDNINANEAPTDDDDENDECEEANEEIEDVGVESDPLNSADDDSETDICAMFESENIVVCQFEKVSRNKNKWKFHLKDGIMNLFGRDLIFSKSIGDAEW